jgi:ubiquinone/menaquinone biosynthesis C-methylase UbiE
VTGERPRGCTLRVSHWEAYYRGGAIAACPLELLDIWSDFFSRLTSGDAMLDIGTGNGAIPLIARRTAASLGHNLEIHGVDLARIDPTRDVSSGEQLFAGIVFHSGVGAEDLPFETSTFAAVTGQYALEYTDVPRSLGEVMRVLKPGSPAQFIVHHAQSVIVEQARAALVHADAVLNGTNLFRKLRRLLEAERRTPSLVRRRRDELSAAIRTLRDMGSPDPHRTIDIAVDAVQKLLSLRQRLAPAAMNREIESVENDFRNAVRRHRDLIAVAATAEIMDATVRCALMHGFIDVHCDPVHYAKQALVAWLLRMRKATEPL